MIYRTTFDRINFNFDPPVKQTADVVFEMDCDEYTDAEWNKFREAAWEAARAQNPHWWTDVEFPIEGYGCWSSVMGGHKFEKVVDKDLDFDLGEPGVGRPRIAETFKKKGWEKEKFKTDRDHSWRVDGFYKTYVYAPDRSNLSEQDRAMAEMTDDIMVEILAEERAEMSPSELARKEREIKIIACTREEAEFVSGVGVSGIILRLEDVEITGRVTWDDRTIARQRRDYKPNDDFPTTWHKYWER